MWRTLASSLLGVITPKEAVTKQRSEKCPTLGLDELLQAAKEALALFERKGDVPDAARTRVLLRYAAEAVRG